MRAPVARRLWQLLEPLHVATTYGSEECTAAFHDLGYEGYWPGYFAGRAAPLGRVPADVVDAVFYNFAPGEVATHVPAVWEVATPEEALAARERGSVAALRRMLGDLADGPEVARAGALAMRAALGAPFHGRPLYAALRSVPVPGEPLARLWHAATLLREHRGDGHVAALVTSGIGSQECHVLLAIDLGTAPRDFGRLDPLSDDDLASVVEGLRRRGLVDDSDGFTVEGRAVKDRVEAVTDALAEPAYDCLDAAEVDRLAHDLAPLATRVEEADS